MALRASDVVPISQARARLTELAEDVVGSGAQKVLTKIGASYVALVDDGNLLILVLDSFRAPHVGANASQELERADSRAERACSAVTRSPGLPLRRPGSLAARPSTAGQR